MTRAAVGSGGLKTVDVCVCVFVHVMRDEPYRLTVPFSWECFEITVIVNNILNCTTYSIFASSAKPRKCLTFLL